MKATAVETENRGRIGRLTGELEGCKIDELLAVLDKDIQHIQQNLSQLNELRSLVVKRDDTALGRLLESIQSRPDTYIKNEVKRQSIRKDLADALACDFNQMTLSLLEASLPKDKKAQIHTRKVKLEALIKELKKEHLSTALLLSECARFNSLVLKSILDLGQAGAVYYNSNGATRRQRDTAFVNLQF